MSLMDNIERCCLQEAEYHIKVERDIGKIMIEDTVSAINVIINKSGEVSCYPFLQSFQIPERKVTFSAANFRMLSR